MAARGFSSPGHRYRMDRMDADQNPQSLVNIPKEMFVKTILRRYLVLLHSHGAYSKLINTNPMLASYILLSKSVP